ncbi:MAG: ferredoxin [Candidatus Marsarchaeota archaeon]|jgi:Fe-S-cluster-containing hydrogenase component 2|nr:ferredoxin [Candidatus Marsarchaeota archaeon]MCL5418320.1 ferredoxin [Candidatus Marsarchaeota archaeon]
MDVYVDKTKCTGCQHCKDVCPVAVFEMKGRGTPDNPDAGGANADTAPEEAKWKGKTEQAIVDKWSNVNDGHRHFAADNDGKSGGLSVAVNGSACILCQACLIECEGECIHITDDTGTKYVSIYK